jgi:hypothetical protein
MTAGEGRKLEANPKWRAFLNGEPMQWRWVTENKWVDNYNIDPSNFIVNDDRIRIKPKPVERWVINHCGTPGFETKEEAELVAQKYPKSTVILMREVEGA